MKLSLSVLLSTILGLTAVYSAEVNTGREEKLDFNSISGPQEWTLRDGRKINGVYNREKALLTFWKIKGSISIAEDELVAASPLHDSLVKGGVDDVDAKKNLTKSPISAEEKAARESVESLTAQIRNLERDLETKRKSLKLTLDRMDGVNFQNPDGPGLYKSLEKLARDLDEQVGSLPEKILTRRIQLISAQERYNVFTGARVAIGDDLKDPASQARKKYQKMPIVDRPGHYIIGVSFESRNKFLATAESQQKSCWCWAACIQAVLSFYGLNISQGEIVSCVFGAKFNAPGSVEEMTRAISSVKFEGDWKLESEPANSPTEIFKFAKNGRYVVVGLFEENADAQIGHAYVLLGLICNSNNQVVEVRLWNPWPNESGVAQDPIDMKIEDFAKSLKMGVLIRRVLTDEAKKRSSSENMVDGLPLQPMPDNSGRTASMPTSTNASARAAAPGPVQMGPNAPPAVAPPAQPSRAPVPAKKP